MDEKRAGVRRRVLKGAFIVIGDKAPKLECTVPNLSETGANLQVSTTVSLPQDFDVILTVHAADVTQCGEPTPR